MANQVHAFKDRDIRRVVKAAARSAGINPTAIEVDPKTGRIKVIGGDPATAEAAMAEADVNPFDREAERLRKAAEEAH